MIDGGGMIDGGVMIDAGVGGVMIDDDEAA